MPTIHSSYTRLESLAIALVGRRFSISLADSAHSDRRYHFKFQNPYDASEFEYRVRSLRHQTTIDTHGNVWVSAESEGISAIRR